VALLMALVARLTDRNRGATLIAGLLFAGGFGHWGEAVLWISGRTGLLADLFALLALRAHWEFLERGRRRHYWLSLAGFGLSLLSKETAVVLLPLLLLLEWAHGRKVRDLLARPTCARYAPLAGLLAAYLAFEFGPLKSQHPAEAGAYTLGWHVGSNLAEYLARL